jgi:hypothetical protein
MPRQNGHNSFVLKALILNPFGIKALRQGPIVYPDENKDFTKKYRGGGEGVIRCERADALLPTFPRAREVEAQERGELKAESCLPNAVKCFLARETSMSFYQ